MADLEDYLRLITPFHRDQPLFSATVSALAERLIELQDFVAHLPQDFDLDEAIGAQLDVDGEWIGRSRLIAVPIPSLYFTFDDPARGFDKGIWFGPYDTESGISRLDDATYRLLLYAKIAANSWDGTVQDAVNALSLFFTDPASFIFIEDNDDMTMTFGISGKVPSTLLLAIWSRGLLPLKPEGVTANYLVTSVNNTALFGFDVSNSYIQGFDQGSWGVSPDWIINNPV